MFISVISEVRLVTTNYIHCGHVQSTPVFRSSQYNVQFQSKAWTSFFVNKGLMDIRGKTNKYKIHNFIFL